MISVPLTSEIVPGLWVGGYLSQVILRPEIRNVVSLIGPVEYRIAEPLDSLLAVHLEDNDTQPLDDIGDIAAWVNSRRTPVLVHCGVGLNRSCLVVAKALMLRGSTAGDAISLIREKRSEHCLCNAYFENWLRGILRGLPAAPDDLDKIARIAYICEQGESVLCISWCWSRSRISGRIRPRRQSRNT